LIYLQNGVNVSFKGFVLSESTVPEIKKELETGKIVVFVAGIPGAGKTYYINNNLPNSEVLDVDNIAMELAGVQGRTEDERHQIRKKTSKAIRIKTEKFKNNIESGISFIDTGIFANLKSTKNKINLAKNNNFKIALIYINVSPELAIKRNIERINKGERGIEPEVADTKIKMKYQDIKEVINIIKHDVDYYLEVK